MQVGLVFGPDEEKKRIVIRSLLIGAAAQKYSELALAMLTNWE